MNNKLSYNNKLSRRVFIYILLCTSVLSVTSTAIQLFVDYKDQLVALDRQFDNIENSYIQSISSSLWDFNEPLVMQQVQGVVRLPNIRFAKITTGFGRVYQYGEQHIEPKKAKQYPLRFEGNSIGDLYIAADHKNIYQQLWQRAGFIVASEFVKIFIVAFFIIIIVHRLITRHIFYITEYSQKFKTSNLDEPLVLPKRHGNNDELDALADAINNMRLELQYDIVKLGEAENALISLNGELEIKVYDRTAKLAAINKQLQQSLDDLTLAKDQLVQSEKMASLGQLVAGVAHEVNTPLGICVTSISALGEKIQQLSTSLSDENLTKRQLSSSLSLIGEYQAIIERSLNKAVELVRGFKSVAVEQHTDPEIEINLAQHVNDVVNTVKTLFKRKHYNIHLSVDSDINLVTYPSAWNQILTNFMTNSHLHGFENSTDGEIHINFTQTENSLILVYKDNGIGLSPHVQKRIFDPFVTTKRGQGGSGLGMNIVFNLVNSKLGGTIECNSVDQGCCFTVVVPLKQKKPLQLVKAT